MVSDIVKKFNFGDTNPDLIIKYMFEGDRITAGSRAIS